jgi:tRNA dimethylallyltransferase
MLKAYEVLIETGQSILYFYKLPKIIFLKNVEYEFINMDVDRHILYQRINDRFGKMLEEGAIEEVKKLLDKTGNNSSFPIFQAIGVKEIAMYLAKEYTFERMKEDVTMKIRHYAKRQITWIKHKFINTQDDDKFKNVFDC